MLFGCGTQRVDAAWVRTGFAGGISFCPRSIQREALRARCLFIGVRTLQYVLQHLGADWGRCRVLLAPAGTPEAPPGPTPQQLRLGATALPPPAPKVLPAWDGAPPIAPPVCGRGPRKPRAVTPRCCRWRSPGAAGGNGRMRVRMRTGWAQLGGVGRACGAGQDAQLRLPPPRSQPRRALPPPPPPPASPPRSAPLLPPRPPAPSFRAFAEPFRPSAHQRQVGFFFPGTLFSLGGSGRVSPGEAGREGEAAPRAVHALPCLSRGRATSCTARNLVSLVPSRHGIPSLLGW